MRRSVLTEGRLIRRSVKWNVIGMGISKSISILAKLVLARLLVPEYFGFVGMVLVFTQIAKIAADMGLKHALIQRKRDAASRLLLDSAFWMLLLIALALILAMEVVGAPLIVWFYGEPRLAEIVMAMSLGILIQNLSVVPEARLSRTMRFKQVAISEFSGTAVGCIAGVTLALLGAGVWSLVSQTLISAAVTTVGLYISAGWLPRFRFSVRTLLGVKDYSSYTLGSRSLIYLQQNLDYLLLGKLMGAYAVGIYAIAFLVTETLRAQIYWIVGKVVFPVYSRLLDQKANIRTIYLGTIRYMTATMFPFAMLLILYAGDAIPALFTERWAGAVDPIRILAVASMVSASAGTPGEVLRGVGKPKLDFGVNLKVTLFVAVPALWIGIEWLGLPGAALAVLFHYLVSRLLFHIAIRREIGLTERELLAAIRPAFLGAMAMILCKVLLTDVHWVAAGAASLVVYAAIVFPAVKSGLKPRRGPGSDLADRRSSSRRSTVVILGTDGVGKTSLAQSLENGVPGGAERLYLGMSFDEKWAVPPARAIYAAHLRCQGRILRALTGALFWYLLFPLELIVRRIALSSKGSGSILLVDRLPGRPFLRGGLFLHCYRLLLPRPDWTILLVGEPATVASRKPGETNVGRTKREMTKWETVARNTGMRRFLRIDTTENDLPSCTRLLLDTVLGRTLAGPALPS